jgi:hypothetical protein
MTALAVPPGQSQTGYADPSKAVQPTVVPSLEKEIKGKATDICAY